MFRKFRAIIKKGLYRGRKVTIVDIHQGVYTGILSDGTRALFFPDELYKKEYFE